MVFIVWKRSAGDVSSVTGLLSRATPSGCWTFLVGTVAFVLAPRGPGSGYKTYKRLGAELKGAHILRWVSGGCFAATRGVFLEGGPC